MKVYTKVVLDMRTLELIEEESFDYEGPVALCKGGGGGGGTGGKVDYPDYMKTRHETWLNAIDGRISTALANNPFTGQNAYNPASRIATFEAAGQSVLDFPWATALSTYSSDTQALVDSSEVDSAISEAMDSHAAVIDEQINSDVLPKYRAGMLNIGSVVSSAYAIGEAIIWARRNTEVSRAGAEARKTVLLDNARMKLEAEKLALDKTSREFDALRFAAALATEQQRVAIVALKEQYDKDLDVDEQEARWDLEVYQYGANMLAAISGGTAHPGTKNEPNRVVSAIGGALSGAASGAMMASAFSGPAAPFVLGGAVLGGLAGLL